MIYDVHTHAMKYPDHFANTFRNQATRMRGYELDWTSDYKKYLSTSLTADQPIKTVVFGGKAKL